MKEALIKLTNVSFYYPGQRSLFSQLNLTLKGGDRVALIGDNGVGKTTLLHIIVGLLKPNSGQVYAFGSRRKTEQDFIDVRRQAGLLFQDPDDMLFSPTVLEDVAFGPMNQGLTQYEAMQIASSTLGSLGLSDFSDRLTHHLSGGEKRMVTLAAVLAMQPKVLLLDEPTNALDVTAKSRFLQVLESLPQAMIVISHEEEVVNRLTHHMLKLENGALK